MTIAGTVAVVGLCFATAISVGSYSFLSPNEFANTALNRLLFRWLLLYCIPYRITTDERAKQRHTMRRPRLSMATFIGMCTYGVCWHALRVVGVRLRGPIPLVLDTINPDPLSFIAYLVVLHDLLHIASFAILLMGLLVFGSRAQLSPLRAEQWNPERHEDPEQGLPTKALSPKASSERFSELWTWLEAASVDLLGRPLPGLAAEFVRIVFNTAGPLRIGKEELPPAAIGLLSANLFPVWLAAEAFDRAAFRATTP